MKKTIIVELVANHLSKSSDDEIQTEFMTVINETTGIYAIQFLNESGVVTHGYPERDKYHQTRKFIRGGNGCFYVDACFRWKSV